MSKQEVLEVINAMPEDVSFDDVLYELYVTNNVRTGYDDYKNGRVRSHSEVRRIFEYEV